MKPTKKYEGTRGSAARPSRPSCWPCRSPGRSRTASRAGTGRSSACLLYLHWGASAAIRADVRAADTREAISGRLISGARYQGGWYPGAGYPKRISGRRISGQQLTGPFGERISGSRVSRRGTDIRETDNSQVPTRGCFTNALLIQSRGRERERERERESRLCRRRV